MTFLIFFILTDVSFFSLVSDSQSVFIIPVSWRPGKIEGQMVLYAPLPHARLIAPTAPSEENNSREDILSVWLYSAKYSARWVENVFFPL